MTIDLKQFHRAFFDEAEEHLGNMEQLLLAIDMDAPDPEELNAIFRAAHSIKGGAATFGFMDMVEVTHVLETLLDRLRKSELTLIPEMVDALLAARDILATQLAELRGEGSVDRAAVEEVRGCLEALANDGSVPPAVPAQPIARAVQRLRITFKTALKAPQVSDVLKDLGFLGEVEVLQRAGRSKGKSTVTELGTWEVVLDGVLDVAEVEALLVERLDPQHLDVTIEGNDAAPTAAVPEAAGNANDDGAFGFFVDPPETAPDVGRSASAGKDDGAFGFFVDLPQTVPQQDSPTGAMSALPMTGALNAVDRPAQERAAVARTGGDSSSIRVGVEKVDQLINLMGELVITQAMLAQNSTRLEPTKHEEMLQGLLQLERNTRSLQEAVMSMRMMPIASVFGRFPRMARDLAAKLGKRIQLKTVGEGTELDKGVLEKIADPLTHLIRNSIDHGIEVPERRQAAGKSDTGTVTLKAFHQGGNIIIQIADDGGGLDRERILDKARERGLAIAENAPDQEVWQLIFAAGFSTAEVVSDVSGRGVGMDVVKRNIQSLGGRVEVESVRGQGTIISVRLPLTLAILDGMSVAVGTERFVVPLTSIVESLQPHAADVRSLQGAAHVVQIRGEYVPVVTLSDLMNVRSGIASFADGILVVLEHEGHKVALFVDELLGQHQVVIKSLETNYRKVGGVSGATIMGDGRVALILDVAQLVGMVSNAAGVQAAA
jgi:two-component system chemotaxis sensor kinase CheA